MEMLTTLTGENKQLFQEGKQCREAVSTHSKLQAALVLQAAQGPSLISLLGA